MEGRHFFLWRWGSGVGEGKGYYFNVASSGAALKATCKVYPLSSPSKPVVSPQKKCFPPMKSGWRAGRAKSEKIASLRHVS